MDEVHERQETSVPETVYVGEDATPRYVSRTKGAPGFSGRSTRTIHAACARARQGGQGTRQAKQIK